MVLYMNRFGFWIVLKRAVAYGKEPLSDVVKNKRMRVRRKVLVVTVVEVMTWAWICLRCLMFLQLASKIERLTAASRRCRKDRSSSITN